MVTWVLLWIIKKAVHKIITARIPRIREESGDQLASRSETLAGVVNRVISFIAWVIAFMMILSVLWPHTKVYFGNPLERKEVK